MTRKKPERQPDSSLDDRISAVNDVAALAIRRLDVLEKRPHIGRAELAKELMAQVSLELDGKLAAEHDTLLGKAIDTLRERIDGLENVKMETVIAWAASLSRHRKKLYVVDGRVEECPIAFTVEADAELYSRAHKTREPKVYVEAIR